MEKRFLNLNFKGGNKERGGGEKKIEKILKVICCIVRFFLWFVAPVQLNKTIKVIKIFALCGQSLVLNALFNNFACSFACCARGSEKLRQFNVHLSMQLLAMSSSKN